jgi:AcrR family transcriptional regulator
MRTADPELIPRIKEKTLALLMRKEPEAITMREIANSCGVSATTLYYYYRDKDALFEEVKLWRLETMDAFILAKTAGIEDAAAAIKAALTAFRDWAFENPRISLLIMGRFKANPSGGEEYYRSTLLGKTLLERAVTQGMARKRDALLDTSLMIAALWGAIEGVLLNRTHPEYWDKGLLFTDKMIELCCSVLLKGEKNEQ